MVKGKETPIPETQGDPCKPLNKLGVEIRAGLPVIPKNPDIRYIFLSPPKFTLGTTVPEPVYIQLLDHPGAISKFFEDAISAFDGDLDALLSAAAVFSAERKEARKDTPIRNAVGRVSKPLHLWRDGSHEWFPATIWTRHQMLLAMVDIIIS
jgi:hypothetical protein